MKNLDLMKLTAEALHERAAYIVDHCESIFVHYERWPGHFENARLAVVAQRNPAKAFSEAFSLLLRAEVPHRRLPPDTTDKRSTAPPKGETP